MATFITSNIGSSFLEVMATLVASNIDSSFLDVMATILTSKFYNSAIEIMATCKAVIYFKEFCHFGKVTFVVIFETKEGYVFLIYILNKS